MKILKTLDKRILIQMYVTADSEKKKSELGKLIGSYPLN